MRLILVRHAETEGNRDRVTQGVQDAPLTDGGKRQATLLAAALAAERIDRIYASDLGRVQATLAPLLRLRPDLPVETVTELRERSFGEFEGVPWGTTSGAAAAAGIDPYRFRPPGGESVSGMGDRVERFARKVIAQNPGRTVCFYTHGGPVAQIVMRLLAIPETEFRTYHPGNAEYTVLEIAETGNRLVAKNVNSHLFGGIDQRDGAR